MLISNRMGKEHKQMIKFATRWVEGLRSLLRVWKQGDEQALALREKMKKDLQSFNENDEIQPWYYT